MKKITPKKISKWVESDAGGVILPLSLENLRAVSYYMFEFAPNEIAAKDMIGAFQLGKLLVVGRRWYLDEVKQGLGLTG